MLLKKFRETGPDVVFLIFIILLGIWINAFLHPQLPATLGFDERPMPLFRLFLYISAFSPLVSVITAFLFVLLISFLLVNFNTSSIFISERTYLPATLYILLTGIIPQITILNPLLPAAVFLILALRRIMDSYKIQGTAYSFFDAGLLIGTGSLFYANLIWFGALIFIGIAIIRTGNIKEIVISVFGLATPVFLFSGFYYVAGNDVSQLWSDAKFNLLEKNSSISLSWPILTGLIISGIIILISVFQLLSAINAKKIKSRKTFVLFFWVIFIAAAVFIFTKPVSVEIFWFAAIPAAYFLSHYFVFARKGFIKEIFFLFFFVMAAIIQIVNYFS